jgi:hypothetical protein
MAEPDTGIQLQREIHRKVVNIRKIDGDIFMYFPLIVKIMQLSNECGATNDSFDWLMDLLKTIEEQYKAGTLNIDSYVRVINLSLQQAQQKVQFLE